MLLTLIAFVSTESRLFLPPPLVAKPCIRPAISTTSSPLAAVATLLAKELPDSFPGASSSATWNAPIGLASVPCFFTCVATLAVARPATVAAKRQSKKKTDAGSGPRQRTSRSGLAKARQEDTTRSQNANAQLARRAVLSAAVSGLALKQVRSAGAASPDLSSPSQPSATAVAPDITSRVRLGIVIGNQPPQFIVIGLYGIAAPLSVKTFEELCAGSLAEAPGVSYTGSIVSEVVRDQYILAGRPAAGVSKFVERELDRTGYVRETMVNKAERLTNDESNTLSHDRAGIVSMARGGGAFEFLITPRANPQLDQSRIVIGEVVDGLNVLNALNELPTRKPSEQRDALGLASFLGLKAGVGLGVIGAVGRTSFGGTPGLAFAAARTALGLGAAAFVGGEDPRVRSRELDNRPLTKVRVLNAKVL